MKGGLLVGWAARGMGRWKAVLMEPPLAQGLQRPRDETGVGGGGGGVGRSPPWARPALGAP